MAAAAALLAAAFTGLAASAAGAAYHTSACTATKNGTAYYGYTHFHYNTSYYYDVDYRLAGGSVTYANDIDVFQWEGSLPFLWAGSGNNVKDGAWRDFNPWGDSNRHKVYSVEYVFDVPNVSDPSCHQWVNNEYV